MNEHVNTYSCMDIKKEPRYRGHVDVGVYIIYRGLYEMVVGGWLLVVFFDY